MKTPVNSRTLKQHITYSWWKYLLIAVAAVFLTDLLYTVTAYRSPAEKKVEFYIYGGMDQEKLTDYMNRVRETEMADMEVMVPQLLLDDTTYGPMQLMTYFAAGEGDVFLLPRDEFISYATSGALLPLEEEEDLMSVFNAAGISLQSGWRRYTETGESHLYGIPQSKLPGLARYAYARDGYLCIAAAGGNDANAVKFLKILSRDMINEPEPEPEAEPEADPAP